MSERLFFGIDLAKLDSDTNVVYVDFDGQIKIEKIDPKEIYNEAAPISTEAYKELLNRLKTEPLTIPILPKENVYMSPVGQSAIHDFWNECKNKAP